MENEELGQETTEEVKTPTIEEQLEAVKTELTVTREKLEQTDKGLRTAHQTLTEKDKQLKKQTDLNSRLDDLDERLKILAAMQAEGIRGEEAEDITPEKRKGLLDHYETIEKQQADKRKQAEVKAQQDDYNQKADALYTRAKITFKDDEEGLEKIEDLLASGRFDRAEKKVANAEGSLPKGENEADRIERLAEEKLLAKMKEKGMLPSDNSEPSGVGTSASKAMEEYVKGKITAEAAKKRGCVFN